MHMIIGLQNKKDEISICRRDYERALMQNPLHLPSRVNLAYTLQVSGKFMHAWRQFTAAIAINPSKWRDHSDTPLTLSENTVMQTLFFVKHSFFCCLKTCIYHYF